jgi:DNA-binding IclR family transcriptional regulator
MNDTLAAMETDAPVGSALARGVGILRSFSGRRQQLSRKELVEITGLPKATVSRLTHALCELGLLRALPRNGTFALAPDLLTLVPPILARMPMRQVARAAMQELADHARAQTTIAAGTGTDLVFVEICQGQGSTVHRPEIGTRLSLTRTASGRVYLLTEHKQARERVLQRLDTAKRTWLLGKLQEARQQLAQRGFAYNIGDMHPDIMGVTIPVRAALDGQILIFTCTVATFQASSEQLVSDIGPRLSALVRNVSATLPEQAAIIDWSTDAMLGTVPDLAMEAAG